MDNLGGLGRMRYVLLIIALFLTVGCTNPREKPKEVPPAPREEPIIPPWHPDHDINKQPHEWNQKRGDEELDAAMDNALQNLVIN